MLAASPLLGRPSPRELVHGYYRYNAVFGRHDHDAAVRVIRVWRAQWYANAVWAPGARCRARASPTAPPPSKRQSVIVGRRSPRRAKPVLRTHAVARTQFTDETAAGRCRLSSSAGSAGRFSFRFRRSFVFFFSSGHRANHHVPRAGSNRPRRSVGFP